MKPHIDLEAALLDFKSAYEVDRDKAFDELLCLLLDPVACETRLIVLDELQRRREPTPRSLAAQQLWQQIVETVATEGPVPALEAGKVTIDELDALTWNAAALREVHQRLLDCEPDVAPSSRENDLTWQAQNNWPELKRRLDELMPDLIAYLGWQDRDVDNLAEILVDRGRKLAAQESFRDAASGWLVEYAQLNGLPVSAPLTKADWRLILYCSAVRNVCETYRRQKSNPSWVTEYFDTLGQPRQVELTELLNVTPASVASRIPSSLPGFRRDVYNQVRSRYERACVEWQVA